MEMEMVADETSEAGGTTATTSFQFALTPAEAFYDVLDLQSKAGMSIYEEATNSLYEDANECFDCDPEQA
jgi:hypothetical protein